MDIAALGVSTADELLGPPAGRHHSACTSAVKPQRPRPPLSNVASSASSSPCWRRTPPARVPPSTTTRPQILYVKFGTTASATSYTVKMVADAYYEVPFGYTGRIDGIWASANGNARVTEMT